MIFPKDTILKNSYKILAIIFIISLIITENAYFQPISNGITNPEPSNNSELNFNATNAYNFIADQLNFGYRVPGLPAHDKCADWIRDTLENRTDAVVTNNFTVHISGEPSYSCQNIIGKINTDKKNIIILSSHWDSRAVAEEDSYNRTSPIPGANDGASGVAVLLELARVLYNIKDRVNAQIWFLFLDAEDQGLSERLYGLQGWDWCEGSIEFNKVIQNYYDPLTQKINSFILLDMVGGTDLQFIDETHSTPSLQSKFFEEGRSLGYTNQFPTNPESYSIIDDHVYFLKNGIPSLDLIINFIGGPWRYHHTHEDNLSHIDVQSLNVTGRTIESFLNHYYTNSTIPNWGTFGINRWISIIYWGLIVIGSISIGTISIIIWKKIKLRKFLKENQELENVGDNS